MSKIIIGSGVASAVVAAVIGFNVLSSDEPAPQVVLAEEVIDVADVTDLFPPSAGETSKPLTVQKKAQVRNEPDVADLPEEPVYNFDQYAIASLQQTRLNGDSRAPKLREKDWERELPTAEELADPEKYQAYEQKNEEQVQRAFIAAAAERIPEIEQAIVEAEERGLDPVQLQDGISKLEKIKAMQAQLKAKFADVEPTPSSL